MHAVTIRHQIRDDQKRAWSKPLAFRAEAGSTARRDGGEARVWWREGGEVREIFIPLGDLKKEILQVVPGQKITYITDAVFTPDNAVKIREMAAGADHLFIEAAFLQENAELAFEKCHLTAHQAGRLACEAGSRSGPFLPI